MRFSFIAGLILFALVANAQTGTYHDQYRPQIHFSPLEKWMNDPNGMVYHNGTYHLFYQYFPNATVWGPMHWAHATSTDLVHWKNQPIALYPDSLGYIFSGSAVVDEHNTSGFGKNGKAPMVAIFTHHDPKGEKSGTSTFQNESLAYSLDEGQTWTKYAGNPVLKNPGIRDFRDPKVMWYEPQKKWVMTLATKDRITFYSSPNLKTWKKESEFGKTIGAHGGVWECPDLFPLSANGKKYWVLIVNINPGGPNKGSATQYFVGEFNGKIFTPVSTTTKWLDYGPDEYAGITWSNTANRRLFLGWMSNWLYAERVPTQAWRSAMTVPRELSLTKINGQLLIASTPVKELNVIADKPTTLTQVSASATKPRHVGNLPSQYRVDFSSTQIKSYTVTLSNDRGEKLLIGYDQSTNQYFIDRTKAGVSNFHKEFAGRFAAPRFTTAKSTDMKIIVDAASVELFADGGLTTMTCIFFPQTPLNYVEVNSSDNFNIQKFTATGLKDIW